MLFPRRFKAWLLMLATSSLMAFWGICFVSPPLSSSENLSQSINPQQINLEQDETYVPPDLKPWVDWVRDTKPDLVCALRSNERVCVWPGLLKVEIGDKNGSFELSVEMDKLGEVILPGGSGVWPLRVNEIVPDGNLQTRQVVVIDRGSVPSVLLSPGVHKLVGQFLWEKKPKFLQIPMHSALIQLWIDGKQVTEPKVSDRGMLWLAFGDGSDEVTGKEGVLDKQSDRVSISVSRMLQDGHPFQVITNLDLLITGKARSISLGNVVPPGGKVFRVDSPLSYRHRMADGDNLTIEARAGSYSMQIYSVYTEPPVNLTVQSSDVLGWPQIETWAWHANEEIRSVEVTGGNLVDPERTQVPSDWRKFPLYLLKTGQGLKLVERKRGVGDLRPNEIKLSRNLWLDQDGQGFSVRDVFSGVMNQGWRVNADPILSLGRVEVDGRDVLITKGHDAIDSLLNLDNAIHGVELRNQTLAITGESRMNEISSFPAIGWQTDVNSLSVSLFLQPGWRLLGAIGADSVTNSWVSKWNLLGLYLILLLSGAIGKLFGWKNAPLGLLAFVLLYKEWEAPFACWFNLILAYALMNVVPTSVFKKYLSWYYIGSLFVAVLALIPFIRYQLLTAFHPQLATDAKSYITTFGDSLGVVAMFVAFLVVVGLAVSIILWMIEGYATKHYGLSILKLAVGLFALAFLASAISSIGAVFFLFGGNFGSVSNTAQVQKNNYDSREERYDSQVTKNDVASNSDTANKMPMYSSSATNLNSRIYNAPFAKDQEMAITSGSLETITDSESGIIDPNAKVQTGPGIPDRYLSQATLIWSGLVTQSQDVRLWLLGPLFNAIISVLRVLLALFLLKLFWRKDCFMEGFQKTSCVGPSPSHLGASANVVPVQAALALLVLFWPSLVCAQNYPSEKLLTELETRLMRNKCTSDCTVASEVKLKATNTELEIEAIVQSRGDGAWAIPGPSREFSPTSVLLDENASVALLRDTANILWVRVPSGNHTLKIKGPVRADRAISLRFDAPSWHVSFSGDDWTAEGIDESGLVKGALQISKASSNRSDASEIESSVVDAALPVRENLQEPETLNLEPWYAITRSISVGVKNSVAVNVVRFGVTDQATVIKLPLLPGESVLTSGFNVKANYIEVNFSRGQNQSSWQSSLLDMESLVLESPHLDRVVETWSLSCSAIYSCSWTGLSPTQTISNAAYFVTWHPRQGEQVHMTMKKLLGVSGEMRTIENAKIGYNIGRRLLETSLKLKIRSSDGGWYRVGFSETAQISSLIVNGNGQPPLFEAGKLALLLRPGLNDVDVLFRDAFHSSVYTSMSPVDLGVHAVNVSQEITIPPGPWVLHAFGPVEGPAILFWPKLMMVLIAAFIFSRYIKSPLTPISWILLGFGLMSLDGVLLIVPAIWFGVMQWKRADNVTSIRIYNMRQIVLVIFGILTLVCLYQAVYSGLILSPDTQVVGNGSSATFLSWYSDRVENILPKVGYVALPFWVWRVVMLLWSSWLVFALLGWLRWGWNSFAEGTYWKRASSCLMSNSENEI